MYNRVADNSVVASLGELVIFATQFCGLMNSG